MNAEEKIELYLRKVNFILNVFVLILNYDVLERNTVD